MCLAFKQESFSLLVLNMFTSIIQENICETVSEKVYLPKIRNRKRMFPDKKKKLMWKL